MKKINNYQKNIIDRMKSNSILKNENDLNFKLKDLFTYIPVIGIFILLCGAAKLMFFYKVFEINIFSFIESSDILTLFLDFIIEFIIIGTIFVAIFIIIIRVIEQIVFFIKNTIIKWGKFKTNDNKPRSLLDKNAYVILLYIIPLIFSVFIVYIIYFEKVRDAETYGYLSIVLLIVVTVYICILIILLTDNRIDTPSLISFIFVVASMVFTFSIYTGVLEASLVLNENGEYYQNDFSFKYNNEIIQRDSTLSYIGNTNKYIFIYDNITGYKKVYLMDKVEDLVLE